MPRSDVPPFSLSAFTRLRRARAIGSAVAGGVAVPLLLLAATPAHAQEATHTVRPGDTLSAIARLHGVSLLDLFALNDMDRDTVLHPGDVIRLGGAPSGGTPAAGTLTVQPGEGWWQLARRSGVPAATLQSLNGMTVHTELHPGMVLKTSAAAAPAPGASAPGTYTVQPNDGWWIIARRTGVEAARLQALNGMSASAELHPGMVLKTTGAAATPVEPVSTVTPSGPTTGQVVTYTVRGGDNLWAISQRFEVSVPRIRELNGLTYLSTIHPGQVLTIQDGTEEPLPDTSDMPIGDTFLHITYPRHVTVSANENLRRLQAMDLPSPEQMQAIVRQTAVDMGVDPRLALAHAYTESRFRMGAVSPGNAIGAMQVIPVTGEFASQLVGRELNLLDPEDNVVAGVAYIKYIQERTPTLSLGIGAYYQGLAGVLDEGPRPDTDDYIAKVKAAMGMF